MKFAANFHFFKLPSLLDKYIFDMKALHKEKLLAKKKCLLISSTVGISTVTKYGMT